MDGFLQSLISLATAGCMLFSSAVDTAAPQNDGDGLLFLVNRTWQVSPDYIPELRMTNVPGQVRRMRPDASAALEEMYAACLAETGKTLVAVSGYRDYDKQARLYQNKLKSVGNKVEKADEYVARPGTSEHQLALAMDVGQANAKNNLMDSFGKTEGGVWVRENCWRFGFILRYGEAWESVTGYRYEPWHVRYVGKEAAAAIHETPMPLETYLLMHREKLLEELLEPALDPANDMTVMVKE